MLKATSADPGTAFVAGTYLKEGTYAGSVDFVVGGAHPMTAVITIHTSDVSRKRFILPPVNEWVVACGIKTKKPPPAHLPTEVPSFDEAIVRIETPAANVAGVYVIARPA